MTVLHLSTYILGSGTSPLPCTALLALTSLSHATAANIQSSSGQPVDNVVLCKCVLDKTKTSPSLAFLRFLFWSWWWDLRVVTFVPSDRPSAHERVDVDTIQIWRSQVKCYGGRNWVKCPKLFFDRIIACTNDDLSGVWLVQLRLSAICSLSQLSFSVSLSRWVWSDEDGAFAAGIHGVPAGLALFQGLPPFSRKGVGKDVKQHQRTDQTS